MTKIINLIKGHPAITTVALGALAIGGYLGKDLLAVATTPRYNVDYTLPTAQRLTPQADETVYRIDATASKATVSLKETLAGVDQDVELTTQGIAGDFAINTTNPSQSRAGQLVVNVEQLRSDNSLRDNRIRADYLESHDYPEAVLDNITFDGLPTTLADGKQEAFKLSGDLTVKGAKQHTTFDATATLKGGVLEAHATANFQLSDFGAGPISIAGLVKTSNDATLTIDITAQNAKNFTPPAKIDVELAKLETSGESPSFKNEILPILEENCAGCHARGRTGQSAWELSKASDASNYAAGLAAVTRAKYMPPWPASDKSLPFEYARGLSQEQINLIQSWAQAGAPLDVAADQKIDPPVEKYDTPLPDFNMHLTFSEPYTDQSGSKDVYRCFRLGPDFAEDGYITGYTFVPDQLQVLHHVRAFLAPASSSEATNQLDDQDSGPGWTCYEGTGFGGSRSGKLIGGWVPGQQPEDMGDLAGFKVNKGDYVIIQIHYNYALGTPADHSGYDVRFTTDKRIDLDTYTLAAPVEIPCPEGVTGELCDRSKALAAVQAKYSAGASTMANGLHTLCGTTPEELAAYSDGITGKTICDFPIRRDSYLVAVLGHEHQIGRTFNMQVIHADGSEGPVVLDIPTWNFNWQLNYQLKTPLELKRGDKLRYTCTWDRSQVYDPVPRYIVFAEGTSDEMCFATLAMVNANADGASQVLSDVRK